MSEKKKLSVIMSLHELDLAKKISDQVLCIGKEGAERFGPPEEVLDEEYVCRLFGIGGKLLSYANSLGFFRQKE